MRLNGEANHQATYTPSYNLEDGQSHTIWVDYDGTSDTLKVYQAEEPSTPKPANAIMTLLNIDLHGLVGEQAYLGFSASTGGDVNNHDVENWQFTITP